MSALNEARRLKGGTASTFCHNNDTYISLLEKTWKRHTKNVFLKTTVWCYPNENIKTSITEKTTTQQDFYFLARIWMSPAKEDLKLSFFPLCGEFFFPTVQYNQPTRTSTVFWNSWNFFPKSCWKECWNQSHFFTN